jgi:hypothetical protein
MRTEALLENNNQSFKELISLNFRESPSKSVVTRTVSTKTLSPKKTTITKTVVTEKEEKYEKKEIITYSGNKEFLNSLDNGSDIREKLRKLDALSTGTTNVSPTKKTTNSENVRNVHFNSTRTETSRDSSAATSSEPRDVDREEEKDEPAAKSSSRYRTATTPARDLWAGRTTPTAAAAPLPAEVDEDRFAGRKARLASLADKFRNMDDDLRHFKPGSGVKDTPPASPGRARAHSPVKTDHLVRSRSPVKEPAVRSNAMQFISPAPATTNSGANREAEEIVRPRPAASPVRSFRSVSPTKAAGPVGVLGSRGKPDESLYTSLKAQGFTESESASKLVYKFSEPEENTRGGTTGVGGVQGSRAFNRSPSPYRSPSKGLRQTPVEEDKEEVQQQERGRAASRSGAILSSPTRSAVEPRSVSPSKPHPLQFVSPQVAAAAAPPPPPPKPSRTYETPKAAPVPAAKSWKMQVETPVASVISSHHQQLEDDRCDTPVLKTVSQKRSMFESRRAPSPPAVDPALLSLTDRKALFEKNQTVPTPVARFGESVTPAMLASRAGTTTAAENGGGRNPPAGEAWRRKRELSPSKQMPSAKRPSPESYVVSATKVRRGAGAGASPEKAAEERGVLPSSSKKVPPAVLPKTQAAAMRKPAEMVDPSPSTPQLGRKVRRNLTF